MYLALRELSTIKLIFVVLHSKQDKSVRQSRTLRWTGVVEEDEGTFCLVWRSEEDGVIAVWMEASGDESAGRFFDAEAL